MSLAQFIDHTILKPTTGLGDIEKTCNEAIAYGFAAVCIPPYYVRDAKQVLGAASVNLATVIGFPFGYSHYRAKSAEAEQALEDGANELDVVMKDVGKLQDTPLNFGLFLQFCMPALQSRVNSRIILALLILQGSLAPTVAQNTNTNSTLLPPGFERRHADGRRNEQGRAGAKQGGRDAEDRHRISGPSGRRERNRRAGARRAARPRAHPAAGG